MLSAAALALAGCGDDEEAKTDSKPAPANPATEGAKSDSKGSTEREGTTIRLSGSEFGQILFGRDKQAIYMFQNDSRNKSACYEECAREWPPVITKGEPRASGGAKASLLGTTKRRDGKLQVTYAGRPLYYYAHEGPGEVRCHNVDLNGGLWWVVGPDGKRRP